MINFPRSYPHERLLKKAVRWSMRNRYHMPSLSELARDRNVEELTALAKDWRSAGLGRLIEVSEEGHRSVHFALNNEAVYVVNRSNQQSFRGWVGSIGRSDWPAAGALIVSITALFKPGS